MDATTRTGDPIADTLREHVLSPISVAETSVEHEYADVEAELEAYERFKDRVAGIDTVSTSSAPAPTPQSREVQSRQRMVERVRSGFRETVMSVDHYDEMYGESLVEHAAAELSADVAVVFRRERATPFTEMTKRVLTSAVERAVEQRETFLDTLEGEQDGLESGRATLASLLDDYGTGTASDAHRADVTERLDDLARERQEVLRSRTTSVRTDGHDLCAYLYRDHEWTYPVLTATTRFRTAAV